MILYNPTVSGSLLVTGSLTTTGTITSQTLVVQTITSSIEFNTGSTRNGTLSTNTHEFTGSVSITGSLAVSGTGTFSANVSTGGTNIVHSIGESYGGGIVFYVYDGGKHGLIAATSDQSTGVIWNNGSSVDCNSVKSGINGGIANTERIIIKQGVGTYAAQLCANFLGGNFADWYMPSPYELNLLYLERVAVGGFTSNTYWSSREPGDTGAIAQNFSNGVQSSFNKGNTFYVRAIRAF